MNWKNEVKDVIVGIVLCYELVSGIILTTIGCIGIEVLSAELVTPLAVLGGVALLMSSLAGISKYSRDGKKQ